jgi:hypothetical protein
MISGRNEDGGLAYPYSAYYAKNARSAGEHIIYHGENCAIEVCAGQDEGQREERVCAECEGGEHDG